MIHPLDWKTLIRCGLLLMMLQAASAQSPAQSPAPSEVITVFATNYVPRHLTNVIRVTIPTNYFYEEFRTNWARERYTNIIYVFRTNPAVEFQTNVADVSQFVTNRITLWRTNLEVVTLTNWETVTFFRTNQLNLPRTNLVEAKAAEIAAARSSQGFEIELARTAQSPRADQFPIRLTLHKGGETINLPVTEWRIEGINGGIFMVGSRPEFTGTLHSGGYQVTARLRNEDGSMRSIWSELRLTSEEQTRRFPASDGTPVR